MLASLGISIGGFFIICHVISMCSLRSGELSKRQNRWRIYIFFVSLCFVAAMSLVGTMVWADWRVSSASCALTSSFLTMLFVNFRQFSGLVLYARAVVVHDGLRLKNSNLLMFREFLWYSITIGVWIVFGWSFWINYAGKVVPEGVCVIYSKYPAVILTFAIMDGIMNVAMLMMFVVPLTSHSREMAGMAVGNAVSDKLKKIIKYNFFLSLSLTLVESMGLVCMTTLLMIADGLVVDPNLEHLQMWSLVPPLMASIISLVGQHSMTWSWVPKRVRQWFDRSTFSANDLNETSTNNANNVKRDEGVMYLGNIHGDGKTIETQIMVRHYVVPFDTLASKLFGMRAAKWIASNYAVYKWPWRVFLFALMGTASTLSILILIGVVQPWVSWLCFSGIVFTLLTDNNFSLSTAKLLLKTFEPLVRIGLSFILMFLLFDVVGWDERCPIAVIIFLGMQYAYFTDALVRESRAVFLWNIYLLSPIIPFWVLILLQGDYIAGRRNTTFVIEIVDRYEYSIYLAARDVAFLLCVLNFIDLLKVSRGKGRQWFLFLNGDVAIKVVGLGDKRKNKIGTELSSPQNPTGDSGYPVQSGVQSGEGSTSPRSPKAYIDHFGGSFIPKLASKARVVDKTASGADSSEQNNSTQDTTDSAPGQPGQPKVLVNVVELRERDSLVVKVFGVKRGGWLLQLYTEPWFRLVNEWLLGFPLAFFVVAILPGFVDPRLSYFFVMSTIPFLRNFGLKSARLMNLLMMKLEFVVEIVLVLGTIAVFVTTYRDTEKAILGYYLAVFWLDIRTNDARCVFFHTGTRRGRRLSPFERLLFRLASFQVAGGFVALTIMIVLGITLNTDYYKGFKFVQDGGTYPTDLDQVFFYEFGSHGIGIVILKLIADVYIDLFSRGKGVHFRYIRAPIAPRFSETSSSSMGKSQKPLSPSAPVNPAMDVFAATYHESAEEKHVETFEATFTNTRA